MTTALSPLAVQRFVDNNGNALAGGLLYTYQAGTSTLQPTYTDSTGVTANPNPVVLNSRGEANVWLTSVQVYKFVLQDYSGALIWTVDNIDPADSQNVQAGIYSYAVATGTANAHSATFTPALTARVDGMLLRYKAPGANTGAVTLNDGLGAVAVVGAAHAALQGGEYAANGDALVVWNSSIGGGSYILLECTGGAVQVAPATQSNQAVNLSQISPVAVRINIASAATLDLTGGAPNNNDIQVTGTATITAVNLAAGRVVRVTAGGAFTLTNNAGIVTNNPGGNVTFGAGDTFMLRATAANVVEVLESVNVATAAQRGSVQLASVSAINSGAAGIVPDAAAVNGASAGYGTLRDQTGSRAFNTTYTNTSGRPIWVHIGCIVSSGTVPAVLTINGITITGSASTGTNTSAVDGIVPPGGTYSLSSAGLSSISQWRELS